MERLAMVTSIGTAALMGVLYVYENLAYLRLLHSLPTGLSAAAALQTENAFYYSYFQELVDVEFLGDGLRKIIWDGRTECPDILNAIRRFNIYQEILLAFEYRCLRSIGFLLPDPFHFFRWHVVVLNGIGQAFLCLLAIEISGNPFASFLCFLISFLNRFQTSRLGNFTSSDLRELWGIPLLWIQTYLIWRLLLAPQSRRLLIKLTLIATTFAFIVSWQFSPFLLLLQATSLYAVNIVAGFDSIRPVVLEILNAYCISMGLAVIVHFGSPYLLTSPFFFQLVALKTATSLCFCHRHSRHFSWISWVRRRFSHVMEGLVAVIVFVLVQKALAPFATADTHVYEILCTKAAAINDVLPASWHLPANKLPSCAEPSFNANLYLIMGVFKLLEWSSAKVYLESTAAPAAAFTCLLVFTRAVYNSLRPADPKVSIQKTAAQSKSEQGEVKAESGSTQTVEDVKIYGEEGEDAALLFFVVQSLLFLLLGCLVNRLRVAFGPPMMVLAAAVWGPKLFPLFLRRWCPRALLAILLSGFVGHVFWLTQMLPCISSDEGVCQHMADKLSNDGDLVDLYDWFNRERYHNTPVLASMNLAGSMRAFTNVPMIIHPQFESENLRKRVQRAYELYNCGSEESFAKTMKELQAQLVIFEYSRCFFTPYKLDDKRKNCNAKKHQTEDLMCMKLHARSRFFELVFMNGNYAVFALRKRPLEGSAPRAPEIRAWLDEESNWKDYMRRCERPAGRQGAKCGARVMEAAAHFHHGLKKAKAAAALRKWALELFPNDGWVNYYQARFLDVDADRPQEAKRFYDTALKLLPNNPKVLTEVILFHDLALQHPTFSASLVERRSRASASSEEKSILEMTGPGVGLLMCEAAVAAKTGGHTALSERLWARARELAPLGQCVKNNWPIINGESTPEESSYDKHYSPWTKVWMVAAGKVSLELAPHHQANARFLVDDDMILWPAQAKPGHWS
ncbi:unnamed protein product [Durusdinium trenchii]|uniref:Uncharacterized protein n=1 Tax=Durusdinium trenchii TaxID=1381693 RepID=A0ABP0RVI2_9DINO